jgi:PrcB C-terminal
MKRQLLMSSVALLAGVLTNGCGTPAALANGNEIPVTIIRLETAANCQGQREDKPGLLGLLLADNASWIKAIASMGTLNLNPASWKPNFDQNTGALLNAGTKPTAGYGLTVLGALRERDSTELIVRVRETKPTSGTISPTVVTSPCALIEVAGKGFLSIRLVMQN